MPPSPTTRTRSEDPGDRTARGPARWCGRTDRAQGPAASRACGLAAALGLAAAGILAAAGEGAAGPTPRYFGTRDLRVPFRIEGVGAAPVAEVHLYATRDGGRTWSLAARWKGASPIAFHAPEDGTFGLRVVPRVWAEDPPPPPSGARPEAVVVVDATPPRLAVRWPDQKGFYQGDPIPLGWTVTDPNLPESPVTIEYATKDPDTWRIVEMEDRPAGRFPASCEAFRWLPPLARGTLRMRISAVDRARNVARSTWSCEIRPLERWAQSRYVSVKPAWRTRQIAVHYRSLGDLREKGLRWVELWYRRRGERWRRHEVPDVDRRSPIPFLAPDDGEYEIFLAGVGPEREDGSAVAWDMEGRALASPDRAPGGRTYPPATFTPPDARTLVDTRPPRVKITSVGPEGAPEGTTWLRAGESIEIRFAVEEEHPAPEGAVRVFYALGDGPWRVLETGLEAIDGGRFRIVLPAIDTESLRLRVTATDAAGWTGTAETEPLTVANAWGDALARARRLYRDGLAAFRSGDRDGALATLLAALRYAREAAAADGADAGANWERRLVRRWTDLAGLVHDIGAIAHALGRREEAEARLREAAGLAFSADLRPQKFLFAFHLVATLLEGPREPGKAKERLEEAGAWLGRIRLAEIYQCRDYRRLESELAELREALAQRLRASTEVFSASLAPATRAPGAPES